MSKPKPKAKRQTKPKAQPKPKAKARRKTAVAAKPSQARAKPPEGPPVSLEGTWGPEDEGDSNVHFTVARVEGAVAVTGVDVFDGERLEISAVVWDGQSLRFETATPSTGSRLSHELRPTSATGAIYSFTIAQPWKKLPG